MTAGCRTDSWKQFTRTTRKPS